MALEDKFRAVCLFGLLGHHVHFANEFYCQVLGSFQSLWVRFSYKPGGDPCYALMVLLSILIALKTGGGRDFSRICPLPAQLS